MNVLGVARRARCLAVLLPNPVQRAADGGVLSIAEYRRRLQRPRVRPLELQLMGE